MGAGEQKELQLGVAICSFKHELYAIHFLSIICSISGVAIDVKAKSKKSVMKKSHMHSGTFY